MSRRILSIGAPILLGIGGAVAGVSVFFAGGATNHSLGPVGPMPNRVQTGPDHDVPCLEPEGEAPVCATPLPALTANDRKLGVPLARASLAVPLDHLGSYRVLLGQATLARGVIERMSFSIENTDSDKFLAPVFYLELEDADTRAILPDNVYEKGVSPGAQRVNVYLRFELTSFTPGAVVEVADIDVR